MPTLQQLKAMQYMEAASLHRREIPHYKRPEIAAAPPLKRYSSAPRIPLPKNWQLKEARLSPLLQHRRSRRTFGKAPLALHSLAYMLWAGQGITASAGKHLLRTAPSAGALYPIETYVSAQNVEELPPGLYHLNVTDFELELILPGSQGDDVAFACLNQQFLADAAAVFIWTAIFRRNASKYGERGLRYVFMDVGHICQNVLLAAEATGSSGCPVAAFFDDELHHLLGVDGQEERAVYLAGVGLPGTTTT